ncbi:pentapeptide repeat-containing protein [Azovibrio restrictus]|uniref:pentapeptide repeat-containing protein n=1 Tax=Azovibrio restrictus TaxID=146938 RepID=UPI0026F1C5EE|nr:pentapeptide repeat-containing protein [Azovibrio restrictus]MDD3484307.1 pentapeptide repeat-containing protein [Azovibrio restrictus]
MMALIEQKKFSNDRAAFHDSDSGVYRYCSFDSFSADGPHIGAVFIGCKFNRVDLYWTMFNCAVLVSCTFEDCVFRGATFAGSKFVDCTFIRCQFVKDNMGGGCTSTDTHWYGCVATECEGWDSLCKK